MKNKGNHVFLDFINFFDDDLETCAEYIFDVMRESIRQTKMKAMFEKMVILKDDTEDGFTSVILLDESHITAHSYTKRGLLALDVFTCGNTNPELVAKFVKDKLEIKYPNIKCINYVTHKRFLYEE
jgi:S-adenosylmethionine decarboxylase